MSYSVAVLSVGAAVLAALLLQSYAQSTPYASLLLCSVLFSSWFGGLGPGLLATALGLLAFGYFFAPITSLAALPAQLPRVLLLAMTALFTVWLSAAQRRAEDALRRGEAYLAEAQRLSRTGSFGWQLATRDLIWSKETYQIFGVDAAVKPTVDLVLERVHPDDRGLVQDEIDRAARGGEDFDFEHRLLMPDGTVKHLHVLARRVTNESGGEEIIGAVMDVTTAREAQEALHTVQAELTHVGRVTALGQLSAAIAHEVNQPLAAILTNAQAGLRWLTRDVPDMGEARAALRRIVEDANRASGVIRRVRGLAKKTEPEAVQLQVNEVIDEAMALVRREALGHRVTVQLQLAAGLPPVHGDRIQLQQVIINLAINACQAMAKVTEGPRVLTIRSERRDAGEVVVAVEDIGVGMDAGSLDRLFTEFYTTKPDGMGMGLSISRSIIEAHGGRVWAVRNTGPGMTFNFTIPVVPTGSTPPGDSYVAPRGEDEVTGGTASS